jgi:predicted  nucleic acid-binding Zn-ribbon protein
MNYSLSPDQFAVLRQISSLLFKEEESVKKIEHQKLRLKKLTDQYEANKQAWSLASSELFQLKQLSSDLEISMNRITKEDELMEKNSNHIFDKNILAKMEHSKAQHAEKKAALEDEWFGVQEKMQECEDHLKKCEGFMEGFTASFKEIQVEADLVIKENEDILAASKEEINQLLTDFPEALQYKIAEVIAAKKPDILTFMHGVSSCSKCANQLPTSYNQLVFEYKFFTQCSSCKRIFCILT